MINKQYKTSPVVGYIRSAKKDDPRLDEWEAQIRAYAAERGYNLVAVLREEGVSGVTTRRPILDQLVKGLTAGEYTGVLIPSISHFTSGSTEAMRVMAKILETGAWIENLKL